MFKNYKFWILYFEYIQKHLSLTQRIDLIIIAITNMINKKDIRFPLLYFIAKVTELKNQILKNKIIGIKFN